MTARLQQSVPTSAISASSLHTSAGTLKSARSSEKASNCSCHWSCKWQMAEWHEHVDIMLIRYLIPRYRSCQDPVVASLGMRHDMMCKRSLLPKHASEQATKMAFCCLVQPTQEAATPALGVDTHRAPLPAWPGFRSNARHLVCKTLQPSKRADHRPCCNSRP